MVGYVAKGLESGGLPINTDLAVGLAIPVIALAVLSTVRRAKRRIARDDAEHAPARTL